MSLCKASTEFFDVGKDTSVLVRERTSSPWNRRSVACSWDSLGPKLSDVFVPSTNVSSARPAQRPARTALEEDLGYSAGVPRTKMSGNQHHTSTSSAAADAAMVLNINSCSLTPRSKAARTNKLPKLNLKALKGAPLATNPWATDCNSLAKGNGSQSARVSNRLSIDAAVPGGFLSARLPGAVSVF